MNPTPLCTRPAQAGRAALQRLVLLSFLILPPTLLASVPTDAFPQPTGVVKGRVIEGKEPGSFANLRVVGTGRGTQADEAGWFTIPGVPVGRHTLRVDLVGRAPHLVAIVVDAGTNAIGSVRLGEARVFEGPTMTVTAKRLDPRSSTVKYDIDRSKLDDLPVDDLEDLVLLVPGVVADASGIHVRGERANGIKTHFDGIEVANPLFGTAPSLPGVAVASASVSVGGMSAEFGNALGGVVQVTTREGGQRFGGDLQWHTDRYGENTKTFTNYDRLSLGMGGPTPVRYLTWFASTEGTWTDTFLDADRTRSVRTWFDFIRLGERQSNAVHSNLKLAWTPGGRGTRKLTLETLRNRAVETPYNHLWSRKGYVQVTATAETTAAGTIVPIARYGPWSAVAEDSTYVYQNLADRVPTVDLAFTQWKAVWTQVVDTTDVWTARVSRHRFDTVESVQGKAPWEYDVQSPGYWDGNLEQDPFFVTHGDFPRYASQATTTWTGKADWTTQRWERHTVKAGVEAIYNAVTLLSMQNPNQEADGLPGLNRSDFTNYNPEGAVFVQDRWEYEGLVLNAGLRLDLFTPGPQIPDEDLPNGRWKSQVSPRLGIAYPISDRDVLSFHYGWTYQTPPRNFVFENRGSSSNAAIRGNPDLEPETNISYQAAVQHMFSNDVFGQFAVFFKDIFGLISSRQAIDEATGLQVPVFVNRDYASSRGFEASLQKRFSHRFSADVNYTFALATGVASDPNTGLQFANGNLLYLPIAEQALEWDQRHTLNANLILRDPGRWGVTFLWTYGSGLPYTPTFRNDRRPDPTWRNTRRLPGQSTLSIVADKFFRAWSQAVTLFVDARNVLDARSIANLSPDNAQNPFVNQVGDDYAIYYTETGRAGGAYLRDVDGDRAEDWVGVNDPRVLTEGRNVRVGVGVSF
jgi:outer membrane receptor protein involved in Fe transport